jgi:hypothetical protein
MGLIDMVAVVDEKRPADCRLRTVRLLMKIVERVGGDTTHARSANSTRAKDI